MRGLIIWGLWLALAAALAAPQRAVGDAAPSLIGDVPPEFADTPADPVILEPIRPLVPDGNDDLARARDCGSSDVLMMSSIVGLLLMLNVAPHRARKALSMSEDRATGKVVAVLNDLIFETKIRSTAQALGFDTTVVRPPAILDTELDRLRPSLLIVDLNTAGVNAVATGNCHAPRPFVVAFVSHVDQDLANQAGAAGADLVLPRSRFTAELPQILQTHCVPP